MPDPLPDFETFLMPTNFNGLAELSIGATSYSLDNVVVSAGYACCPAVPVELSQFNVQ